MQIVPDVPFVQEGAGTEGTKENDPVPLVVVVALTVAQVTPSTVPFGSRTDVASTV